MAIRLRSLNHFRMERIIRSTEAPIDFMPLKTREELEEIYQNLIKRTTHVEAVQLLDSLQVDAMRQAADVAANHDPERTGIGYHKAILNALENREKI